MKKPNESLFRLIKAMAPAEKRYFNLYANRHVIGAQNNYLRLFRLVNEQETYDERALKLALADSGQKDHFPVLKRQLYQLLLDCLGQYHRQAHPAEQVKRKIQAAGILKEKGLLSESYRELKSARKIINRYQLFVHLPELLQLEKNLLEQEISRLPHGRKLEVWRKEWNETLSNLEQEGRFAYYHLRMAKRQYQKVRLSAGGEEDAIQEIINDDDFAQGQRAESLLARMDYFRTLATYHFMAREAERALFCNRALLNLLDEHPFLQELYPSRYIVALNNYLIDNFQLKNWAQVEEGLAKLRSLPSHPAFKALKGVKKKIFEQSTLLELNMLSSRKEYRKAYRRLPAIMEELSAYSASIALPNKLSIQYLLAYTAFLNKEYNQSLSVLNQILQEQRKGLMEELYRFARLLQLLVHYELGNYELLSYLITSTRRQHQGLQPAYQAENLLLDSLRRLVNAPDTHQKEEIVSKLGENLKQRMLPSREARFFEYLDLAYWMQASPFGARGIQSDTEK